MLNDPPTCSEARRELEAFSLNELSGREARSLQRHLRSCSSCATEAREVARLISGVRSLASPRPGVHPSRIVATATLTAGLVCLITWTFSGARPARAPETALLRNSRASPEVERLIAAQRPDGSWDDPGGTSPALTMGLSALATVGCLRDVTGDSRALAAGDRGCKFLVQALAASRREDDTEEAPDLRLRAYGAAAWALGIAAERWPGRYRVEAANAFRRLDALARSWVREDGGIAPSDLTRLVMSSAYREVASLRIAGFRVEPVEYADVDDTTAGRTATRLIAHAREPKPAGAPAVSQLASRILANALPRPGSARF